MHHSVKWRGFIISQGAGITAAADVAASSPTPVLASTPTPDPSPAPSDGPADPCVTPAPAPPLTASTVASCQLLPLALSDGMINLHLKHELWCNAQQYGNIFLNK